MRLRILHITPYFAEAWAYGGIPRIAATLARELGRRSHAVTVCTTDAADAVRRAAGTPATGAAQRPWPGVEVRTFPNVSNALAYHLQCFLPRGLDAFLSDHAGAFDVAHLHACRNVPVSLAARHLSRAGVPYVLAPNGTAPRIERRHVAKWIYDHSIGREDLSGAAVVLAVTEAERRQLESFGVSPNRIRVVPNPVDLAEHDRSPAVGRLRGRLGLNGVPVILFLGKLTPRKRVDALVRAVARLDTTEAHLVIAGNDMGAEGAIREEIARQRLERRTHVIGLLRGAERLDALADADLVVYPSADEIFGLVPLEALLAGTPVVVADDSGCGEVIASVGGGSIVPLNDDRTLAQAIDGMLRELDVWRARLPEAAASIRVRFGSDVVAAALDDVYQELVAARVH
jgi:glycosyltransferase involved in cell wall biosynthesis